MIIFVLPAGAFITLGFVIAAVNACINKINEKKSSKEAEH